MKIKLNRSWGSNRRGKVIDYPEKTARYLVERVKVAEYVEEEIVAPVVAKKEKVMVTAPLQTEAPEIDLMEDTETEAPKKRGRRKKSEYETKVMHADIDE